PVWATLRHRIHPHNTSLAVDPSQYRCISAAYALGRKSNKSGTRCSAALKLRPGHLTATLVSLRASEPLDSTPGSATVVTASSPRSALPAFLATTYASGDGE
ncbi:hypothetical protein DFH08DRAFT_1082572, partial [Mycena albidolilacea]